MREWIAEGGAIVQVAEKDRSYAARKEGAAEVYAQRWAGGEEWKELTDEWHGSPLERLHQAARWAYDGISHRVWSPDGSTGDAQRALSLGNKATVYHDSYEAKPEQGYTFYGASYTNMARGTR